MNMEILAGAVSGLITSLVGLYIALRMLKPNIALTKSQEKSNITTAAETSVKALLDVLAFLQKERAEYMVREEQRDADMEELKSGKAERIRQIEELRKQNEEMAAQIITNSDQVERLNREYTKQIAKMQEQIETWKNQYSELKEKYHKVVEFFAGYLAQRGETVPPDLAHLMGDSIAKFKLKGEK